jgi:predicted AAA+ superfamily ATPase
MLSVELGTHLTGRHLSMELFPFSYSEFLAFGGKQNDPRAVDEYMRTGGIPEYVKNRLPAILHSLVDDILMRDIAVRHSVRDVMSLRRLAVYLITNIGNTVSANKLVGMFDIKSAGTLLEYFSYLRDAYLVEFVPMFSHSLKNQARNPKKVYVMDPGLYTENAVSTSDNTGHRFENLVFLHLRRLHHQIFYHKGQGECDFVVMEKGRVTAAVQACHTVNDDNFRREFDGLVGAMREFGLAEGVIVTLDQSDEFRTDGMTVRLVSASDYLLIY